MYCLRVICVAVIGVACTSASGNRRIGKMLNDPWLSVSIEPKKVVYEEGSTVDLLCSAAATPMAVISWFHNGNPIETNLKPIDDTLVEEQVKNNDLPKLQDSITQSRLRIDCISNKTVGLYECVATNGILTKSTFSNVQMQKKALLDETNVECRKTNFDKQPASIYMWTDGRLERPGVTVQLICRANGIPQPTIRWYEYRSQIITPFTKRNQLQLLTDSENYHLLPNGDLLTTTPINATEGGTVYKCIASNRWGQDSVNVMLNWPLVR